MECRPISSLTELLSWEKDDSHYPKKIHPEPVSIFNRNGDPVKDSKAPRLLLCHDMKGGYIEDRFYDGHSDASAYTFWHWAQIDEFVYFSHQFVTVPPCGWVDAAHTHGVPIYGTIISESWDGAARCRELLASAAAVDAAVDRLVALSRHHGLDGWLVNIENEVLPEQVPLLRRLLRRLTQLMHSYRPHSRVIWYDSVTCDGSLLWQDQLNDLNQCFFDECDGIFLNYGWRAAALAASLVRAGARHRDVYAGVDVFGRGSLGNGGFGCLTAVAEARWLGLSSALFAPGWTHERLGAARFPVAEAVLWTRLQRLLGTRGPCRLPLTTSLCLGRGQRRYRRGQVVSDVPWHHLSEQQLQPTYLQRRRPAELLLTDADLRPLTPQQAAPRLTAPVALAALDDASSCCDAGWEEERRQIEATCAAGEVLPQPGWTATPTSEDGFSGGGALLLTNHSDGDGVYRLWACNLPVEASQRPLVVMYAVKSLSDGAADRSALCLDTEESPGAGASCHVLASSRGNMPRVQLGPRYDRVSVYRPSAPAQVTDAETWTDQAYNGWIVRRYQVSAGYVGRSGRITSIGAYLPAGASLLLGYLDLRQPD